MKKLYALITLFLICGTATSQNVIFSGTGFKNELLGLPTGETCALNALGNPMIVDINGDNQIQLSEALNVYGIQIHLTSHIDNLVGLENFTNLKTLNFDNCHLTTFNFPQLVNLEVLSCQNNSLTNLDLTIYLNLKVMGCSGNALTVLTSNSVSHFEFFDCSYNNLTNLEINNAIPNTAAMPWYFDCSNNQIENLTLSGNFGDILCGSNQLITLDLRNCLFESVSYAYNEPLTSAIFKNGQDNTLEGNFNFGITNEGTPNLQYVCVDEGFEMQYIQDDTFFQTFNWTINSDCFALPGEETQTFDSIAQNAAVCDGSQATFTVFGLVPESTSTLEYKIAAGPAQSVMGVGADSFGSATFQVPLAIADNGQLLTLLSVTRTDAAAPILNLSENNTVALLVNANAIYFADTDADGYGNAAVSQTACAAVTGYVLDDTDCDDNVFAINPGHVEVFFNGVDDNCDGNFDEGNQITTSLLASDCNSTLAAIGSLVGIQTIAPAATITGWRVRATNGAQVQVIEINVPHFTMQQFASYAYATTYTIDIQLQRNGVWLGYYGPTCQISTPAILAEGGAAQVSPSQCGIVLPKINTLIATTSLAGVTGYRFRVTNLTDPSGPNAVQTIDRTQNWVSLQMLARYNYGTTYRIEVAVKSGAGAFGGFGSPCEVSSPPAPSLVNCGGIVASGTAYISATSVAGATQYRFQITRQSDLASSTIDRNVNYFTFNSVPAAISSPGVLYAVRVAVYTAGTWSPFGDACEITSPGTAARFTTAAPRKESTAFKATAYPNPFVSNFGIDVTTSSDANVQVKVYDMLGKLIESREVKVSELDAQKVGDRYPSGVYNLIVSQSDIVKTLRVIKR
ncbi:MAG TPA: T9SS type A sorting domain-containing protein [Flavobacterium sp.]|nr:T9SS type A sorting domain-containing protein [Flavobacterium sp.]